MWVCNRKKMLVWVTSVKAQHSQSCSHPLLLHPLPQDVAAECEVKCMPTFQFFKKGQKVGTSDLERKHVVKEETEWT